MKRLFLLLAIAPALACAEIVETDVLVFGGTASGVAAACTAARLGKRAVVTEFGTHIGGLTSGGFAVTYTIGANLITATANGQTVFTMALDASTGEWAFTLLKPLDHPTLNGVAGDDTENNLTLSFGGLVQATDKDGDTVTGTGTVNVVVNDDTPIAVANGSSTGTVDEDGLANGIPGGTGDVAGEATIATGSVTALFQSGADIPLSYGFNTTGTMTAGLSSGGVALTYVIGANLITASAGAPWSICRAICEAIGLPQLPQR